MFCNVLAVMLAVWAAAADIGYRLIPNRVAMISAAVCLCIATLEHHCVQSLGVASVVFLLVVFLWRLGVMGGGDAKLIAALSLGLSAADAANFVLFVACCGGILAIFYKIVRQVTAFHPMPRPSTRLRRFMRAELWRIHRGCPLPYAVAIMSGFVVLKLR